MLIDHVTVFVQEWGTPLSLLLLVALLMAADLFPKLRTFMAEVEQRYPNAVNAIGFLVKREQYVIDCYDRLPARIRAGFAAIGGRRSWAWLVKAGYAYLRKKQN